VDIFCRHLKFLEMNNRLVPRKGTHVPALNHYLLTM
jgi:hypothetical protein